jgi:hypothetical protein
MNLSATKWASVNMHSTHEPGTRLCSDPSRISLASPLTLQGDLLTSWSFSFQTREQLQADLLRCQAKIEDLEKLLVEKGQVRNRMVVFLMCLEG